MPLTEDQIYLLHERISIKQDSGIPEHIAEQQAREEIFGDKQEDLWRR